MKQTMLIADGNAEFCDIYRKFVKDHGYDVETSSDGILLDVEMPGLDGSETLDGIRQLNVDIPVCFMTGDPGDYEPSDLLRQGARHLFSKPFRMEEIVRVVSDLANETMGCPQEN